MAIRRSRKSEVIIDCVNYSTVVSQTDFERWLTAQQQQIDNEFGAEWDTVAKLGCSQVEQVPSNAWDFALLDDSDQANALGYHDDVYGPLGQPQGKAFAKTDIDSGHLWSVTAGHEINEMLGDPDINRVVMVDARVFGAPNSLLVLAALENSDACEADEFAKAFRIGGKTRGTDVYLSDFVMRAWFEQPQGRPVDAYGHLSQPFEIGPGGYIGIYVPGRGWTQAFHNEPIDLEMRGSALRRAAVDARIRHPAIDDSPRRKLRWQQTPVSFKNPGAS